MEDQKKHIQFVSTHKKHADLKVCLQYDDLKIGEFFNSVVDAYVNDDEDMRVFIDRLRENKQVSKVKRTRTNKEIEKAKQIKRQFTLDVEEIENIFDILEKEIDVL